MIKGLLSYLKSLKLFGIGFGISCFILLGSFVNAGQIGTIGQLTQSPYNSSYNFQVNGQGNLLTQYFGLGKRVLQFEDGVYFFWSLNSIPYIYVSSNHNGPTGNAVQGYLNSYALCDIIGLNSGNASEPNNCQSYNIDGLSNFLGRYLNSLSNNGYYYYDYYQLNAPARQAYCGSLTICFSNSSFDKSLCFYGGNGGFAYPCNNGNLGYPSGIYGNTSNLTNSLGLSPYFDSINNSVIGISPGQSGYSGSSDGFVNGGIDNSITGDTLNGSITWGDIRTYFESEGFSRYLCYGGIDNFDLYDSSINYNVIPGTGKSLLQIWGWSGSRAWDNFNDWFRYWNGTYRDTVNNFTALWESYPAVYHSYFQLYNLYKPSLAEPRQILEYCNMILNFSEETYSHTVSGSGTYWSSYVDFILNEKQTGLWDKRLDGTLYPGGIYTGDTPISTNWNGVGNMTGITEQKTAINFIQDFFNKAKSVIPTNYSGTGGGFLPSYIILFLLAIILFRFLSH